MRSIIRHVESILRIFHISCNRSKNQELDGQCLHKKLFEATPTFKCDVGFDLFDQLRKIGVGKPESIAKCLGGEAASVTKLARHTPGLST